MPVVLPIGTAKLGMSVLPSEVGIKLFLDLTRHALPGIGADQRIARECLEQFLDRCLRDLVGPPRSASMTNICASAPKREKSINSQTNAMLVLGFGMALSLCRIKKEEESRGRCPGLYAVRWSRARRVADAMRSHEPANSRGGGGYRPRWDGPVLLRRLARAASHLNWVIRLPVTV